MKRMSLGFKDKPGFEKIKVNGTTGGFLLKRYVNNADGGIIYLEKTGTLHNKRFSNKEVVIECICSDIADYLNIPHAKYTFYNETLDVNNNWICQDILVSRSDWFLTKNEVLLHANKIVSPSNYRKQDAYYEILKLYPQFKEDLDTMIVFDYLVNNTDRHFKNFGVILNHNTSEVRFSPLYDHGFSLGIEYDSEFLGLVLDENEDDLDFDLEENLCNSDVSKSFGSTNKSCIQLVNKCDLLKNKNLDDILSIVDNYSSYLPEDNLTFAKIIISRRFNNLVDRFGD